MNAVDALNTSRYGPFSMILSITCILFQRFSEFITASAQWLVWCLYNDSHHKSYCLVSQPPEPSLLLWTWSNSWEWCSQISWNARFRYIESILVLTLTQRSEISLWLVGTVAPPHTMFFFYSLACPWCQPWWMSAFFSPPHSPSVESLIYPAMIMLAMEMTLLLVLTYPDWYSLLWRQAIKTKINKSPDQCHINN